MAFNIDFLSRFSKPKGGRQKAHQSLTSDVLQNIGSGGDPLELAGLLTSDSRNFQLKQGGRSDIAVGAMLGKAFSLEQEANQRHSSALDMLMKGFESSEAGLNEKFKARGTDQIADQANRAMQGIRAALGQRGIGANSRAAMGITAGLFDQIQNMHEGMRRDVEIDTAQRRFQKIAGIAQFMDQDPSMLGADALASMVDMRLAQQGVKATTDAAKQQAKATQTAGIIGGVTGLLGGLF